MTRTELLELITNGENSGVEFKQDAVDNTGLAKEIVAFANLRGGIVLLGVDDGGNVVGLTRPALEEWVMEACRSKIRPELIPYYEVVRDVEPGRDVAVVTVEPGWTVHAVWHNTRRTYYIRVGTTSREAGADELERLFQHRGNLRSELRPISGTSLADLDRRRLSDYFSRVRQHAVPDLEADAEWTTLLTNTEFLAFSNGHFVCTMAGLLLFGTNPNRFLPQAGINAAAYPGTAKDYATRERTRISGAITPLFGAQGIIETGVIEQAVEFVRRNTIPAANLDDGARRVQHWQYPEEAVREALVNAVVHRDYLLSATDIELSIYSDRIEFVSPGRLPNGITEDRMRTGCRASRNQLLKDVMADYGYLEHMGMGVPRKIIKLTREQLGTEPELVADNDGEQFLVRLRLPAPPQGAVNLFPESGQQVDPPTEGAD